MLCAGEDMDFFPFSPLLTVHTPLLERSSNRKDLFFYVTTTTIKFPSIITNFNENEIKSKVHVCSGGYAGGGRAGGTAHPSPAPPPQKK